MTCTEWLRLEHTTRRHVRTRPCTHALLRAHASVRVHYVSEQDRAPDDFSECLRALFLEVIIEHAYDWMSAAS